MEELKFPIGRFQYTGPYTEAEKKQLINEITEVPQQLKEAVKGLTLQQLELPYRPEGWTVRQVTNHMADSHMNAFIRFKLALTEDNPTIKPYNEDAWVRLGDTTNTPIELSISLIEALHAKWVALLKSLTSDDLNKSFLHPENGAMKLEKVLGLYAWHGKHHIAHITSLRKRMGI